MGDINLIPWREQARELNRKQFIALTVAVFTISFLLLLVVGALLSWRISHQNHRNQLLVQEINDLDAKNRSISRIKEKRAQLVKRMQVIQNLQAHRPMVVHLFDELVNTLPAGVFLKQLRRRGMLVTLSGVSESNSYISDFMRNIERASWLGSPLLQEIKTDPIPEAPYEVNNFTLQMALHMPDGERQRG